MHEMGVALNIINRIERHIETLDLKRVARVTLRIGELSSVVPDYLEKCWGHATDKTLLADSELAFEIEDGILVCNNCRLEFRALENEVQGIPQCPACKSENWNVKCGNGLVIKDITIEERANGTV